MMLMLTNEDGAASFFPWHDITRNHSWGGWRRVHIEDEPERLAVFEVECRRCRQTREVYPDVELATIRPGCPKVPFAYRAVLAMRGDHFPTWDVNERPPWMRNDS